MTPTERKLQALAAARLNAEPEQVPLDASYQEALGLDSYDLMGLLLDIEDAFAPASLSDPAARELKTLREVGKFLDSRQNDAARPLLPDYSAGDEFTEFTSLDGEDFLE